VVGVEEGQAFFQLREMLGQDERDAGPDAGLVAPRRLQGDGGDSVIEELGDEPAPREPRIGDGEIEAVGERLVAVLVVDEREPVF
jgi:hypothetical protein